MVPGHVSWCAGESVVQTFMFLRKCDFCDQDFDGFTSALSVKGRYLLLQLYSFQGLFWDVQVHLPASVVAPGEKKI